MENMLVTVIICYKDDERFLLDAIESVKNQTYTNWEIVLVNDGSTDLSTLIAKNAEDTGQGRIRYSSHPGFANKGLSASRNLGLSLAKGGLICFLDADDILLPNKLEEQFRLLQAHPTADLVCEATRYWFSWADPLKEDKIVYVGAPSGRVYQPTELLLSLYPLGKGSAPCMHSMILRKTVFDSNGGFEPSFTGMYEDQVFLTKIYLHKNVYISDSCNNLYRIREDSMSQKAMQSGQYYHYRKAYLAWLTQYLKSNGNDTDKLNDIIVAATKEIKPWRVFTGKIFNKFRSEKT
jgi:glycosyltransferase involved in cell wall biosynthesis